MTAPSLSGRQQEVLGLVVAAGGPVTTKSVAEGAGLRSCSHACRQLRTLEEKGLVGHQGDRGRFTWEATEAGTAQAGAGAAWPQDPDDVPELAGEVFAAFRGAKDHLTDGELAALLPAHGGNAPARRGVRDSLAWLARQPHAVLAPAADPAGWRLTGLGAAMRDMARAERDADPDEPAPAYLRLFILASRCAGPGGMPAWIADGIARWAGLGSIGIQDPAETRPRWELAGDTEMIAWAQCPPGSADGWLLAISARSPAGTWEPVREVKVPDLAELAFQVREITGGRTDAPLAWKPGGFYSLSEPGDRDPGFDAVRQRIASIVTGLPA